MRLLVTAGPTREPIDDVRFISNASSGKLGLAIVEAARARGHDVALVLGPVELAPPASVELRRVETTADLAAACRELFPSCDAVVMAAAPADFRPRDRVRGKIKKEGRASLTIDLVPNDDVVAELGASKRAGQLVLGFALESAAPEQALANARAKLARKRLDAIVLNAPSNLGAERASATILDARGEIARELKDVTKAELARAIVELVERYSKKHENP